MNAETLCALLNLNNGALLLQQRGPGGHTWSVGCRNCHTSSGSGERGSFARFKNGLEQRGQPAFRWTEVSETPHHFPYNKPPTPASGICYRCTPRVAEQRRAQQEERRLQHAQAQRQREAELKRQLLAARAAATEALRRLTLQPTTVAPATPATPVASVVPLLLAADALLPVAASATASASTTNVVDDDLLCCVCLDVQKTHTFIPCGHLCVCNSCGPTIINTTSKCPLCQGASSSVVEIFQ